MCRVAQNAAKLVLLVALFVAAERATIAATEMVPMIIDGSPAQEKAAVIDGVPYLPLSMLGRLEDKIVKYDAAKKMIVAGDSSGSVDNPQVKPVLEVVMGEPQYKYMVESLGLQYRSSVTVPEKLQFYSCVIINNDNAVSPRIAGRLKDYVTSGGSLVMLGIIPALLSRDPSDKFQERSIATKLNSIADWFGCTTMRGVRDWSFFDGYRIDGSAAITVNLGKVMGSRFKAGDVLFKFQGDMNYPLLEKPDEFCQIVAVWSADQEQWNNGLGGKPGVPPVADRIAALARQQGKGWLYWQSLAVDPNYPGISDLLKAAINRGARGR